MSSVSGIQIIGTQRSGSNLLRVILDQSPQIASPHPPHILVSFMPLLHLYGDLSFSYKNLVRDVVEYVNANPVPWAGIRLDENSLIEKSEYKNLFELNKLIYEEAAIQKQAKYWCCKSMANVHFSSQLEQYNRELKYIFLFRDGRDVAASFKKAIVGEKHIYHIAKQWKHDQDACIGLREAVLPNRFFSLSYESLLNNPEATVRSVCDFLEIDFTEDMLDFYKSTESKNTAEAGAMWENLKKPIIKNNSGKFVKQLSETEIKIFETIAVDVLQQLNYPVTTQANFTDLLAEDLIKEYHLENERLKAIAKTTASLDDIKKRKSQQLIIKRIKEQCQ